MPDLGDLLREIQAQHAAVPAEEWAAQRKRFILIGEAAMMAAEAQMLYPEMPGEPLWQPHITTPIKEAI